jgi:N-formylglutamate deformylase
MAGSGQPIGPDTRPGDLPPWDMIVQPGPVMITAVHAGHTIRPSLHPWLAIGERDRLREEDPLTDFFLGAGDTIVRANRSRFEFDLNRPAQKAVAVDPEDSWGLQIWSPDLPRHEIDASLDLHSRFYALITARIEAMIAEHGRILVLDIHSYNHRRNGTDGAPDPQADSPDIDLGATTLNKAVYGDLLDAFAQGLRSRPVRGTPPDVRINVRWPDGGHFPEWLHATYGDAACVITLEYKKIFMDEWGESADILALQDLREGFHAGLANARAWLAQSVAGP